MATREYDPGLTFPLCVPCVVGGIQPKDVVVSVDGARLADMDTKAASAAMMGDEGSVAVIEMSRGGTIMTVHLPRSTPKVTVQESSRSINSSESPASHI